MEGAMTRRRWDKLRQKDLMRRQGVESVKDVEPSIVRTLLPPRRRRIQPSKEELRRQAAAAFMAWRQRQMH
jgi:hypothetical protein